MKEIFIVYAYEKNLVTEQFSPKTVLSVHKTLEGAELFLDKQEQLVQSQSDPHEATRVSSHFTEDGRFKGGFYAYSKRNRRIQHWFLISRKPIVP